MIFFHAMFLKKERIHLFLLGLYEMAKGNPHQSVETKYLSKKIGMEEPELGGVGHYLKQEGLIKYSSFNFINLSHQGRKEGEKLMEESYSQKKRRVLEAIAEISSMSDVVSFPDLAQRLQMSDQELSRYCSGLDEGGLIDFRGGDIIQMRDAGWEALEPKKPSPPQNIMYIDKNYGAAAQGTNITQNIYNNQPLSEIIPQLVGLINAVKAEEFNDKDEVIADLQRAIELAHSNPDAKENDVVWKRIATRLTAAKTTMEIAGFVVKSYPYWPQIIDFFSRHIQ